MRKLLILATIGFCAFSAQANAYDTLAKNALLIDVQTGSILFEKNADTPMPPASMSKLMTAYMIFDALKQGKITMDTEFYTSENAWRKGGAKSGSSTMFLNINQPVKVHDLLRGIIVQSGNDACIVAAENLAGSEEAFAEMMNEKAKELGLKTATFKNATGLPDPEHRMSPKDLAKLAKALIETFPEYYPIYSEKSFKFNGINQGNRNPLLYTMPNADGLKTGHTSEAGYGLTASAKTADGRRLVMVINGLQSMKDRTSEAQKLMNWGLMGFENKKLVEKGSVVETIPVWLGKEATVEAVAAKDFLTTVQKGQKPSKKMTVAYDSPVEAPIQKGQKIGTLTIEDSFEPVVIDLVAKEGVERVGLFGKIKHIALSIFAKNEQETTTEKADE